VLEQVLERYPKEVKLVFKNYPLARHKFARKAAAAALAANEQGKFWELHIKLYKDYKALNDAKIQEIAQNLGLDMEKFTRDMASSAIQKLITRDFNDGRGVGVTGIPTVFINGKVMKRRNLQGFQQVIAAELKKTK
jgi:protein-disulfide isomerase